MTTGALILLVLLSALLYSGKVARPAWSSPPFTTPGYVNSHLHGFRQHVNKVRQSKCLSRFAPFVLTNSELAAASDARRRVVRLAWKARHFRAHAARPTCTPWYVTKQIAAGNVLGRESLGDPWPNCPDPYDGGGYSWTDTVNCENGGNWLDSPGFYRCGLQFHPNWENRFGRLCP